MKIYKILLSGILAISLLSIAGVGTDDSDKLLGVWESADGRAKIKIEKIGNKFFGKIIWLKVPNYPSTNKPKLDQNNPDTAMRKNPIKGNRILKDFIYKGNKEWGDGSIYDPNNGKTYKCVITMKDDSKIDIRGYVGIKTLGRTESWKRSTNN